MAKKNMDAVGEENITPIKMRYAVVLQSPTLNHFTFYNSLMVPSDSYHSSIKVYGSTVVDDWYALLTDL